MAAGAPFEGPGLVWDSFDNLAPPGGSEIVDLKKDPQLPRQRPARCSAKSKEKDTKGFGNRV